MTPDPIKLLAVVHRRDMNDNTAKDNWEDRQKHHTLESTSMTMMKNYSAEKNQIQTKGISELLQSGLQMS